MAKTAEIKVRLTDIPEVAEHLASLRSLLQAWEPRVICPQCGERYKHRACGPTHAVIYALVYPEDQT